MIVASSLRKHFGAVQALDDVSFAAADGRITGLLGHNGAGKSTTLRILSTVMRADSGSATVNGHDCATRSLEVRQSLGVLPHSSGLYAQLTGRENIEYYGRLHGLRALPRGGQSSSRTPRPIPSSCCWTGMCGWSRRRPKASR